MNRKDWREIRRKYRQGDWDAEAQAFGPPFMRKHNFAKGRHRGFFFFRFLLVFGFMAMLFVAAIAALWWSIQQVLVGGEFSLPSNPIWFLACLAVPLFPIIMFSLAGWTRRRITDPLANIVDASEKVTAGDLSVRIPENEHGEFARLERAFNGMISELERTEDMRRNLAADVAHELNTPIHIIQGYLEGIQDEVYSPDPETVTVMLEETRLLSRLVEDLRTLSLAEAGQLPLKMSRVDLTELIEDVRISFSGQAEAAQVTIQTEVTDDLFIQADPDRLDQILTNLLANALRYSPAKGRIDITASQDAEALTITVADTGAGIDPADLPFIFDRFWRADKSRSHADGSGHGLGLAITRQLVQAHGGDISVASHLGQGTTFTISLALTPQ